MRQRGAVFPQQAHKVRRAHHYGLLLAERLKDGVDVGGANGRSVERECGLGHVRESGGEPFGDEHLLRHAGLVKFHSGTRKLGVCLNEVAGVRPQAGMVCGYHHISAFAGETREPAHLLVALGRILAAMGV